MSYYELLNRQEREAEKKMAKQSDRIHKALKGQLSPTTEEWIKARRKEQ